MPTVAEALAEGLAHHRAGRLIEARRIYRRVLAFDRSQADALHLLGALELAAGQVELAVALLGESVAVSPLNSTVHSNLARALQKTGATDRAAQSFRRSLAVSPEDAAIWSELGRLGSLPAALDRALALDPAASDSLNSRAIEAYQSGESKRATRLFRRALAIDPAGSGTWQNFGLAIRSDDHLVQATVAFRRAISIDPRYVNALEALGWTSHLAGNAPAAVDAYRRALAADPERIEIHANLILSLNCIAEIGPEEILAEQRRWSDRFARPFVRPPVETDRSPERRLRVGYVGVEGFQAHTAAVTLLPLITAHDRSQVEIVCYSDVDPARADGVTHRLKELAGLWRDTRGTDDEAFAAQVRADRIDVLADVYGYPPGCRLLVLARSPAPVQVNLLPMGSFGLDAVPWMVGDERLTPAGSESWFLERVVHLPLAFCYWPVRQPAAIGPGPALRGGPVTFGSFNQPAKVSDRCLRLWGRILAALPGSRLLLKGMAYVDPDARRCLVERAAKAGVDTDRLQAIAWIGDGGQHHALYGEIDVALDPLPYGGVITTCEALSLGVPVVTRAGDRLLGRYGATLLPAVELEDLVAESDDAYVDKAVALAQDRARLATLRATLGERFLRSRICNAESYARSIEAAYRQMWRSWCASA
jgi:predicted O-linked N-acetylglucosamine transferase (SPINDLY family)